jgi:cytochrome c peroxidase
MRFTNGIALMLFTTQLPIGCDSEAPPVDELTDVERAKVAELSPLEALPTDSTNAVADDPRAAVLGQKFFFDSDFSGPLTVGDDGTNGALGAVGDEGKIACRSCHLGSWLFDSRSNPNETALGSDWGARNAPSLINASHYEWLHWDGRMDSPWASPLGAIENPKSMNSNRLRLAHTVYAKYKDEYDAIFTPPLDPALDPAHPDAARFPATGKPKAQMTDPDGPWEMMTPEDRTIINRIYVNFGKVAAAYLRVLNSENSPFDRYVAGETAAISASAKRGLKLFIGKAACVECHSTPIFSDDKFHVTGVPQRGEHAPTVDKGRFDALKGLLASPFNTAGMFSDDPNTGKLEGLAQVEEETGKFRTKGLRQVKETGPYMHAGQFKSLREVVEFYDKGGEETGFSGVKDPLLKPLNLTSDEIDDIVAFLETLTGDPVSSDLLTDTSN